jgi:hypothetical protein
LHYKIKTALIIAALETSLPSKPFYIAFVQLTFLMLSPALSRSKNKQLSIIPVEDNNQQIGRKILILSF